jgi:hypothetical protein
MKTGSFLMVAVLGAALAASAWGQGGPGGRGRYAIGANNTPGWTLMTPEERAGHRQKMWSFSSFDECKAYQAEHHQLMETRAKEQGKALPAMRANACDRMKARGLLK